MDPNFQHTKKEMKTTGWFVARWIIGLFLVMIIANVTFLYFAVNSHSGNQVEDAYERGFYYNDQLEKERQQAALGWQYSLSKTPEAFIIHLKDKNGAPLEGGEISGQLFRPTDSRLDKPLVPSELGQGKYELKYEAPLTGQWELQLQFKHAEDLIDINERVVIEP